MFCLDDSIRKLIIKLIRLAWTGRELHLTRDIDMSCGDHHILLPMSFTKDNSQPNCAGLISPEDARMLFW